MRIALLSSLLVLVSALPALALPDIDRNGDSRISRGEFFEHLRLRHALRDRSHDGEISYHELTGRFVGGSAPFTPSEARNFLRSFDLDRSGGVSLREMIFVIEYTGAFAVVDRNDDGYISISESRGIRFLNDPAKRRDPILRGLDPK